MLSETLMKLRGVGFTMLISLLILGGLAAGLSSETKAYAQTGGSVVVDTSSADYQLFIQPNLANIELVRSYLMRPFQQGSTRLGYNSQYGMIEGGHWPNSCTGVQFQICPTPDGGAGFVLVDNNLLIGSTLDYLNSLNGIQTNILGNTRSYLSQTFVDPTNPGSTATYNGQDRREIFLGNSSPYFGHIQCVYSGGTQSWYISSNNYNQPNTITTELPGVSTPDDHSGCDSNTGAQSLEEFSPLVILTFEKGQTAQAQSMFLQTVAAWNGLSFGSSGYDP